MGILNLKWPWRNVQDELLPAPRFIGVGELLKLDAVQENQELGQEEAEFLESLKSNAKALIQQKIDGALSDEVVGNLTILRGEVDSLPNVNCLHNYLLCVLDEPLYGETGLNFSSITDKAAAFLSQDYVLDLTDDMEESVRDFEPVVIPFPFKPKEPVVTVEGRGEELADVIKPKETLRDKSTMLIASAGLLSHKLSRTLRKSFTELKNKMESLTGVGEKRLDKINNLDLSKPESEPIAPVVVEQDNNPTDGRPVIDDADYADEPNRDFLGLPPEPEKTGFRKLAGRLGGIAKRAFGSAVSNAVENFEKNLRHDVSVVKNTFNNAAKSTVRNFREKPLSTTFTLVASVGVGATASAFSPVAFAAVPAVAVVKEVMNSVKEQRRLSFTKMGKNMAISSVISVATFGLGEGLGIEDWFTGNDAPAGNVDVPPEVTSPEPTVNAEPDAPTEALVPVETSLSDLVGQVDTSAAEAAGWDYSWQEDILNNPEASDEIRAQIIKDYSFAAGLDGNLELQGQLLEAAQDLDPTNVQVEADLEYMNTLSQG